MANDHTSQRQAVRGWPKPSNDYQVYKLTFGNERVRLFVRLAMITTISVEISIIY
jgi:hypothetical protein